MAETRLRAVIESGGERLFIASDVPWVTSVIRAMAGDDLEPGAAQDRTVEVRVEASGEPFEVGTWEPLTRGAWTLNGALVMTDVCASGFDLRLEVVRGVPVFTYRYRPRALVRVASLLLRARGVLLARAVLSQYPVLWWAGHRGRVPLHAPACTAGDSVPLIAGPAGVGKSTLLALERRLGGVAVSDNLVVSNGETAWGIVEALRVEGKGRTTTHGRVEVRFEGRVASLQPNVLVVLRRGFGEDPEVASCDADRAVRSLVTGTYMAGELRRYWAFAATLSAATGCGPAHPPVEEVAGRLASRLRCVEVRLARRPGVLLSTLLAPLEVVA